MRNITNVKGLQECEDCNLRGFFCYIDGADYITCPCCGNDDYMTSLDRDHPNYICDHNNMRTTYQYCEACRIIFVGAGCIHAGHEWRSYIYNAHFIKKWRDKITCVEYCGMPEFNDLDDWVNNCNNIEVLELHCPHDGNRCLIRTFSLKNYELCGAKTFGK
jgi:hypothetical protein